MASTSKPNPIPDRYRRVTPALVVAGAAALEFCAEVFGATERMRFPGPDGTVAHAEVEIGDSVVIVEDASPVMGTKAPPAGGLEGTPTFLFVYVEDVDAVIERAVKLGATLKRAPQEQFYGRSRAIGRRPILTAPGLGYERVRGGHVGLDVFGCRYEMTGLRTA